MAKKLTQTVKGYEGTLDADDARHVVRQPKGYEPGRTALKTPGSKPPATIPLWSATNHRCGSKNQQPPYPALRDISMGENLGLLYR